MRWWVRSDFGGVDGGVYGVVGVVSQREEREV
jgi:hypothetical protein